MLDLGTLYINNIYKLCKGKVGSTVNLSIDLNISKRTKDPLIKA